MRRNPTRQPQGNDPLNNPPRYEPSIEDEGLEYALKRHAEGDRIFGDIENGVVNTNRYNTNVQEILQNTQTQIDDLPEQVFTPIQQNLTDLKEQHVITESWFQVHQYLNYFWKYPLYTVTTGVFLFGAGFFIYHWVLKRKRLSVRATESLLRWLKR